MTRLTLFRIVVIVLVLSPLTLAVPRLVDDGGVDAPDTPAGPTTRAAAPLAVRPVLGFAIVAHHISDLDLYLDSVDRIAELGANALVIVTPMFQTKIDSSEIRFLPNRCPTDEQLTAILRRAKRIGLLTTLQPIVLIAEPGDDDWRGVIRPADWDAWWASYGKFIDRYLAIAAAADVDMLAVGSELNATENQPERWQAVVRQVRDGFDGPITYSANWDRYHKVDFWPLVDFISVSSYFELRRDDPDAPEAELVEDWVKVRDRLLAFAEKWERPLVLSEVGYPSVPWASAHPWNYVATAGTEADHEAQARCYRAFFKAWSDTVTDADSPAAGFFCYHWDPYKHGNDRDTGYGIRGKPAYGVVRKGLAAINEAGD